MRSKFVPMILMLLSVLLLLTACSSPSAGPDAPPVEEEPPRTDPPPVEDPEPEVTYLITGQSIAVGSRSVYVSVHKAVDGVVDRANPVTDATVTANGGIPMPLVDTGRGYQGDLGVTLNPGDAIEVTVTVDGNTITGSGILPPDITQTAPADGEVIPAGDPVIVEWTTSPSPDRYAFLIVWTDAMTWQYEPDGTSRSFELQLERTDYSGGPMTVRIVGFHEGSFTGDHVHPGSTLQLENRAAWPAAEFSIEVP